MLYESRLRVPLPPPAADTTTNTTRRETAITHGFRKFFDTTCTHSGMNPIYIEWCMGHKLKGVKDSYFNPQPNSNGIYIDILEGHEKSLGYIDAIDSLTINEENRLKKQVEMLKVRKDEFEYLKQQVEENKKAQSKVFDMQEQIDEIRRRVGIGLGIPKERMDKTEIILKPGVVDLDAEIMAEMNSKSKKEDNND